MRRIDVSVGETMEERAFAEIEPEFPEPPLPQRGRRRPWWRNPATIATAAVIAVVAALTAGFIIGNSGKKTPAASVVQTSAVVESSSAPTDAPSTSECTQFAAVYNGKVGPALTATSDGTNNVLWTQKADAFQALADVLDAGADPYSRTLAADTAAVVTSDRQYDADGSAFGATNTFLTDLAPFLTQCHMH